MGGVNTTRHYAHTMGFGHWDEAEQIVKVDKPLLQGGIVAVYYLPGTLVGALWGGWLGDRYGRISTLGFGCLWTIFGAILQASAQNADWMFCGKQIWRSRPPLKIHWTDKPSSCDQWRWHWHSDSYHSRLGYGNCVSPF